MRLTENLTISKNKRGQSSLKRCVFKARFFPMTRSLIDIPRVKLQITFSRDKSQRQAEFVSIQLGFQLKRSMTRFSEKLRVLDREAQLPQRNYGLYTKRKHYFPTRYFQQRQFPRARMKSRALTTNLSNPICFPG